MRHIPSVPSSFHFLALPFAIAGHRPEFSSPPSPTSIQRPLCFFNRMFLHLRAVWHYDYDNSSDSPIGVLGWVPRPSPAIPSRRAARTVRAKEIRQCDCGAGTTCVYQFQSSSSSSFVSGVEGAGRADTATTSGRMARLKAVLPASSSSSSISDAVTGADTGTGFADDAGASAEKIDCDTSESSTEARFWPFANLDKQKTKNGTRQQSA